MPEKLQTLLFIGIGLLALVVRWWRKAKEAMRREAQERRLPRPDQPRPVRPASPGAPATSFEELLKQMQTQNKNQGVPTLPQATVIPETTPAGRSLPREKARTARSLERTETSPVSLEAPVAARSLEAAPPIRQRASTLPRANTSRPNDYWSRQAASTGLSRADTQRRVTDLLRNPADVRAAFVLSEILKRKYE
ncbi:hypothetical protein [Hymenobacter sp. GOD-10R]|uniref:hypothetical protein n=1 Tax=Hymenobacter sp. GOD-10R TaxID=3093922 RepID=UPI002D767213|nr:hypothetical protein [Hymenobacter sp. GOD-10R]WRQ30925.1 hypothetical protein SD425_11710 [Hymenobacter sp. GOD-10R]